MKRFIPVLLGTFLLGSFALGVTLPYTHQSGQQIEAAKVNANEQALRDAVNSHEADSNAHNTTLEEVLGNGNSAGSTSIDFNLTQGLEFRLENLASAPTCDASSEGRLYWNTVSGLFAVCQGASGTWTSVAGASTPNLASVLAGGNVASGGVGIDLSGETLTNALIDADTNTITNIENADIKASAAIEMDKLEALSVSRALETDASGFVVASTVTATELGRLTGVTSSLCGITQTCTQTNKTFTSPTLTTPGLDIASFDGQGSDPANPSAGFYKFWIADDGIAYILDSAGTKTAVGSGSGSTENVFETMNAPSGTDPVADSATDTLNFTSSDSTIGITGVDTTDTLNFTVGSNLTDGNIDAAAGIQWGKLAQGSAGHALITDGSGYPSSEAQLATSRGGTGQDLSGSTGVLKVTAGTVSATTVNVGTEITGTLAIGNGGTGETTATAAFNALDPLTTKGDIVVHNGTNSVREGIGTDGQVLVADSSENNGMKWATFPAGPHANYITNPGWESTSNNWTASGGTYARTTTASEVGASVAGGSWDASGSQTLTSDQVTLANNVRGACLGHVWAKGGDSNLTLQVIDGSSNVLASQAMSASTEFTPYNVPFGCPTSGTVALRVSAGADAAVVYLDDAYLGLDYRVGAISQATFFGSITYEATASCEWTTTSGSFANFAADTDCPAASVSGQASAPGTKIPAIVFSSLPAGTYQFVARGGFEKAGASDASAFFRFSDGTNHSEGQSVYVSGTSLAMAPTISGRITYSSTQSNATINIQAAQNGSTTAGIWAAGIPLTIDVYRFPSSSETVFQADALNWRVDANISGANPSLGTAAVSSYSGITDTSLTLTNNSTGTLTAMVPCSSTNAPSGTTCSAGSESIGVSFTPPGGWTGTYEACVSFSHFTDGDSAPTFQIVETAANAQTVIQEGKGRPQGGQTTGTLSHASPFYMCGTFAASAAGQKTLRLFYEQGATTASNNLVLADAGASNGQRDVHWTVRPINQNVMAPVLVGQVSSNTTGQERVERAKINCDAGSAITSQSGSWISSVGNIASGACAITLASGIFSSTPTCTASLNQALGTFTAGVQVLPSSATAISVGCTYLNNGSSTVNNCTTSDFDLICMGPR